MLASLASPTRTCTLLGVLPREGARSARARALPAAAAAARAAILWLLTLDSLPTAGSVIPGVDGKDAHYGSLTVGYGCGDGNAQRKEEEAPRVAPGRAGQAARGNAAARRERRDAVHVQKWDQG